MFLEYRSRQEAFCQIWSWVLTFLLWTRLCASPKNVTTFSVVMYDDQSFSFLVERLALILDLCCIFIFQFSVLPHPSQPMSFLLFYLVPTYLSSVQVQSCQYLIIYIHGLKLGRRGVHATYRGEVGHWNVWNDHLGTCSRRSDLLYDFDIGAQHMFWLPAACIACYCDVPQS